MSPEVVRRVVLRNLGQLNFCYEQAAATNPTLVGRLSMSFSIDENGMVTESAVDLGALRSPTLGTCVAGAVRRFRFPAFDQGSRVVIPLALSLEDRGAYGVFRPRLPGFVLSRLHARYGRELSDDLVFREARAIQGGRESRDASGALEQGAQPAQYGTNNFQARYAIRHPWTGPIACANPRRGVWGGPPRGVEGSTHAQPARGLAFAPRGAIRLDQALGAMGSGSGPSSANTTVPTQLDASVTEGRVATTPSAATPNTPAPRGRFGCTIARAPSAPNSAPGSLWVWAAVAASALVRKRPRDDA
jgi:hypothetical protein